MHFWMLVNDSGEIRNVPETRLKQDSRVVKFFFDKFMGALGFAVIYNENIDRNSFWRDDTHPTNEDTSLLSKIFSEHLNSFCHQNMEFSVSFVNKIWRV